MDTELNSCCKLITWFDQEIVNSVTSIKKNPLVTKQTVCMDQVYLV